MGWKLGAKTISFGKTGLINLWWLVSMLYGEKIIKIQSQFLIFQMSHKYKYFLKIILVTSPLHDAYCHYFQKRIQNPVKNVWGAFCKKLQLRCLTVFWIRLLCSMRHLPVSRTLLSRDFRYIPVDKRRHFDVYKTYIQCREVARLMHVKMTLWVYGDQVDFKE